MNMPFSLCGAYLAWKVVPETRTNEKLVVDVPGALLLLLTFFFFLLALESKIQNPKSCLAGVAGLEPAPKVLETSMLTIDTIPLNPK